METVTMNGHKLVVNPCTKEVLSAPIEWWEKLSEHCKRGLVRTETYPSLWGHTAVFLAG